MVAGGSGLIIVALVITTVAFFGWRKSAIKWQRVVAWIGGILAALLILFYLLVFLGLSLI
jgi:hypothetical protein